MTRPATVLIVGLWAALQSGTAAADLLNEAEQAFAQGEFLSAARLGEQLGTAAGLALAARATLVYAEFEAERADQSGRVEEARNFAATALERDGRNVEALIQMAAVTGYLARQNGVVAAHFQGLADDGRGYLERALDLDPDSAWANGALGAWHLEVVHQGGETLAAAFYDASTELGMASFKKALEIDPGNLTLHTEFAIALLTLDRDRYLADAIIHLRRSLVLEPRTALDDLQRQRAQLLLTAAEQADRGMLAGEIRKIRELRRMPRETHLREHRD